MSDEPWVYFVPPAIIFLAASLICYWLSAAPPIMRVFAFDNPDDYARQGYHQCDHPSGWCDNEREENPCGN